tara:strand:- start:3980 stop:5863 length:1884 start_codon:yes stop_codon:yes gene_type:complete
MPATLNIGMSNGKDNGSKDLTNAVKDLTAVINGGSKVKGGKRQQKKQANITAEKASALGIPTTQKQQDTANKRAKRDWKKTGDTPKKNAIPLTAPKIDNLKRAKEQAAKEEVPEKTARELAVQKLQSRKAAERKIEQYAGQGTMLQQGVVGGKAPTRDLKKDAGKALTGTKKMMTSAMSAGMDKSKKLSKMGSKGLGMAGISMSLSSLLRMSQVFTGTIGALFQVLGGFIDAILAPFMPYLIGMIGKLGQQIPKVQAFAQRVHDFLAYIIPKIWTFFSTAFPVIPLVISAISTYYKFLWGLVVKFWDWISNEGEWWSGPLHPVKGFFETVWGYLEDTWDTLVKVWDYVSALWTRTLKPWLFKKYNQLKALWDTISDMWTNTVKPYIKQKWEELKTKFTEIKDAAIAWWKDTGKPLFDEAQLIFTDIKTELLKLVKPLIDVIKPLLVLGFKFIMWFGGVVWNVLKGMLSWLWDNIYKPLLTFIKDNLVDFLKPKLEWLAEKLNALVDWFNSPGSVFQKLHLTVLNFAKTIIDFFANSRFFSSEGAKGAQATLATKIYDLEKAMRPTNSNYGSPAPNVNLNVNNNISGGGIIDTQTQYAQGRAGLNTMFNNVSFESNTSALNAIVDAKG